MDKLNKIIEQVLEVKINKPSEKIIPVSLDTFKKAYIDWFRKEWGDTPFFENEAYVEEFIENISNCNNFEEMVEALNNMGFVGEEQIAMDLFNIFIKQ